LSGQVGQKKGKKGPGGGQHCVLKNGVRGGKHKRTLLEGNKRGTGGGRRATIRGVRKREAAQQRGVFRRSEKHQ